MYEVEVKLRADHAVVEDRLAELDARRERTVEQTDTYYDAPHRSFAETDEALRVRRVRRLDDDADGSSPTETRVTYKGPLVDDASKSRVEHETGVDDDRTMADVLEALGFAPVATVEKRRDEYSLDDRTVVLDDVVGLGTFVEVELESEDVDAARERCFETVRDLGLDPEEGVRTSYLELLLDEGGADAANAPENRR